MTHLLFCVSRAIQRRLDEVQIAWLGDQQAEPVHFVFEKFYYVNPQYVPEDDKRWQILTQPSNK